MLIQILTAGLMKFLVYVLSWLSNEFRELSNSFNIAGSLISDCMVMFFSEIKFEDFMTKPADNDNILFKHI